MRGIVRAGAYLPASSQGGRRRCAADEDEFTLVATALERAGTPRPGSGAPMRVRPVGDAGRLRAELLAGFVGGPVELGEPEDGRGALYRALALAARAAGPEWLVVATRLGDGSSDSELAPPGEGSAALLIDDAPEAAPIPTESSGTPGAPDPLSEVFAALARSSTPPSLHAGDWGADPARGRAGPTGRPGPREPAYTVAQGAFVPGPRYAESVRSRWRFIADRCRVCDAQTFPARGRCGSCGRSDRLEDAPLPLDNATVLASTWIGQGGQPTEFDAQVEASGPYGVVLAEIAPGVRLTLMVADATKEEVPVGSRVDSRLRRLYAIEGSWRYGRKAVPSAASARARPAAASL